MKVYSYSQARQQLASLLEEASRTGVVNIRRRDGTVFKLTRVEERESGLDVPGLATGIGTAEMLSIVRKSRARTIAARAPAGRGQSVSAGRHPGGKIPRRRRPRPQQGR
jgi:hypothetical protein